CVPKGIEIRTTIHSSVKDTLSELTESFLLLTGMAKSFGFTPVLVSFNPFSTAFEPDPPLNVYEVKRRQASPEKQTAHIPMLTYGPDLSLSVKGLTTEQVIDVGKKLTHYSPFIVPFSYSSPFYGGTLWSGFSVRTFVRTGARPAAMVFIDKPEKFLKSSPSLTKRARIPAEVGRIEFKAFDSCGDFSLYGGLLALLKGLVIDLSLSGRAVVPDAVMHQVSAREGFENNQIFLGAKEIVDAVKTALDQDPDCELLTPIDKLLKARITPAHRLIEIFHHECSIEKTLQKTYTKFTG
ncbi:MAG: glutamate--cysteine ligase, partial [Deltaproteobacteria bacterium]|nr:glutamate--cysteine ligase [Deltaproteobacteria bacterium]